MPGEAAFVEHLSAVNNVEILSVYDSEFLKFGKPVDGFDFESLINKADLYTGVPAAGNVYVASEPKLEKDKSFNLISNVIYGGMPIQIGFCNGKNTKYNAFEYHKGSEVNIAVTDFMLALGDAREIKGNKYTLGSEKIFFVPQGTAFEMYQTTLHFSPIRVHDSGFKNIVILPRGTNTALHIKEESANAEDVLLFQKNKWLLTFPDNENLIKKGAYPGLVGENKELKY